MQHAPTISQAAPLATILHVPFTYFPDTAGGTEVYVKQLIGELAPLGYHCAVAAPAATTTSYIHDDIEVHRFAIDATSRLEFAYGAPDKIAAANFASILDHVRPDIVHVHACTAAVSPLLIDAARDFRAKVVLTYHTPTMTCARGDMLLYGSAACDGFIADKRCTTCALTGRGVPRAAASLAANLPAGIATAANRFAWLPNGARIPGLLRTQLRIMKQALDGPDHIVAVCDWVKSVLLRNGIPPEKLTLSRQGIRTQGLLQSRPRDAGTPLRLAYFGRVEPTKGPKLLVEALALISDVKVALDIFGVHQDPCNHYADALRTQSANDPRIRLLAPVPPGTVCETMQGYDIIAVPSRWLETGPLVVLEAFAAGVPVLGAKLGGIAELVHDGADGILVTPADTAAWASAIRRLAGEPEHVAKLRAGIRPPRTMADAAADMAAIYRALHESRLARDCPSGIFTA